MINICKNLFCILFILLINLYPFDINAMASKWIEVPRSEFGQQFWDKNSIQNNVDGSIRIQSKFVANSGDIEIQEILYTMEINCKDNTFRDIATGSKKLYEFKNKNSKWNNPKGDKLINGVIYQVCRDR